MLNEAKADQLRGLWLYLEKADDSIHQVLKPKRTFSLFKFEFPFIFNLFSFLLQITTSFSSVIFSCLVSPSPRYILPMAF